MADPVSLTLALLPIVAGLGKALITLDDLRRDISFAREEVIDLHQDMTVLNQLLLFIHRALEKVPVESIDSETVELGKTLRRSTKKVVRKFKAILPQIKDMCQQSRLGRIWKGIGWTYQKRDLKYLQSALNAHKVNLTIFMHGVQIRYLEYKLKPPEETDTKPPPAAVEALRDEIVQLQTQVLFERTIAQAAVQRHQQLLRDLSMSLERDVFLQQTRATVRAAELQVAALRQSQMMRETWRSLQRASQHQRQVTSQTFG